METLGAPMSMYWMRKTGTVKLLVKFYLQCSLELAQIGIRLCGTQTAMIHWGSLNHLKTQVSSISGCNTSNL